MIYTWKAEANKDDIGAVKKESICRFYIITPTKLIIYCDIHKKTNLNLPLLQPTNSLPFAIAISYSIKNANV